MALNKVTVSWCMVVWCTHNLRRDGSIFTWQPSLFAGRQQGCDTHCCSFIVCCKTARVCHPLLQFSLFAARQQRCASLWLKNIRQCHHVCWRFRWLTLWHPNHRLLTCSQIRHKAPVSLVHLVPQFQSIGKRANRSRLTTLLTSFLKTIDKTSVLCLAARLMKLRYLRCGLMSVGLPFFS